MLLNFVKKYTLRSYNFKLSQTVLSRTSTFESHFSVKQQQLIRHFKATTTITQQNSLLKSSKASRMSNMMTTISKELSSSSTTINIPSGQTKNLPLIRVNNIKKSEYDTRDYRGLQLENGLEILLISDPETDISAASLAVHVGHMLDPVDLPGLAHFCEHMLFLGTEKYPHENGYTAFLTQNCGNSNAVTCPLMTRYHFHVAPDKLDEALDRFAQFFIAPLFTASATDREINAVDSEHEKNISSDLWRLKQVQRHLAKSDHAFSKFGTGNKMTLHEIPKSKNINVRDALLDFHKKWYSANIMSLAVLGKESLDDLEQIVVDKFASIENKNVQVPSWPREPYAEDQYATKVMIVPIKDLRSLSICFTTDDLTEYYKSSPSCYLSHLIGHESKGSILEELRKLGYCNGLRAGHQSTKNGFGFFEITVDLTKEGVNHVDDIIEIIFQYLRLLRETGPIKWIFEECTTMSETVFRFKDKSDPENLVITVASSLKLYPLPEVLSAPYLSHEWDPDFITKLLNEFTPRKCRVNLVSQSYESICTETEPHYGTKYHIEPIPEATLKRWENCQLNPNLAMPEPNPFMPTNFDLLPQDADVSKHPHVLIDSPYLRLWHKQDDEFLRPKGSIAIDFQNPIAHHDPLYKCLNQLMVTMLKDQLNDYLYDAELGGLRLQLLPKHSGLQLGIYGYSDKQIVLLKTLLQHIFKFTCDKTRFEILREEYFRIMKNYQAEQPYQQSTYYLSLLMTECVWSEEEIMETKELVTYARLMRYAEEFFARVNAECFIHGNYNKEKALNIGHLINQYLEQTDAKILPLLARQLFRRREIKLLPGDSYLFEKQNLYHKNSCIQLYFQMGVQTDRANIMSSLISQIMNEPCYDCLRTKEQLGYIVASGVRKVNSVVGMRIIVQSTRHPSFLEERIENFIETFIKTLEEMSLEEFEKHKEALILKKLEKHKSQQHRFNAFYNEISNGQYHFDRNEAEVEILRTITHEELIDSFKKYIGAQGSQRRIVAVHILSKDLEIEEPKITRHTKITDLSGFKTSKELYPLVPPAIDIRNKGARSKL